MTTTVSGSQITFNDNTTQNTSAYGGGFAFRNRIINGAMIINQRSWSGTITTDGTYTLDRWQAFSSAASKYSVSQNAGSVTPPAGYINYLGVTSLAATTVGATDYYFLRQCVEGLNVTDLGWGAAGASTVTLSFWVRSSLTGTFGGTLENNAQNRSYPFSYTISAANTWEQKTITITGDTTGTWLTTNGIGIMLQFGLGVGSTYSDTANAWTSKASAWSATGATSVVGTNGATFYITGVQLEKGSTATSFDYRPYSAELAMCQRYYYKILPNADYGLLASGGYSYAANGLFLNAVFPVTMRVGPSSLETTGTAGNYRISNPGNNITLNAVPSLDVGTPQGCTLNATTASGVLANLPAMLRTNGTSGYLAWSAEL